MENEVEEIREVKVTLCTFMSNLTQVFAGIKFSNPIIERCCQ